MNSRQDNDELIESGDFPESGEIKSSRGNPLRDTSDKNENEKNPIQNELSEAVKTLKALDAGIKVAGDRIPQPLGSIKDLVVMLADIGSDTEKTNTDIICVGVNKITTGTVRGVMTVGVGAGVAVITPTLEPVSRLTMGFTLGVAAQPTIESLSKPFGNVAEHVCRTTLKYSEKIVIGTKNMLADGTGVHERFGVDFNFNGQHYSMETGIGLEINVGTENNAVVSTNCRDGYCNITLRAGNDRYVNLNTPYHHINNSNSRNNKDAGVERLKNDLNILSKTNHSSGVSDNAIFSYSNSTSRMMDGLRSLNDSQHDFNRSLTSSRVDNFSQFTNQSRETYYFGSANEAARYSSFFSNYFSGDFRQTPSPVDNNHSFFGGWSGSNGGKSGYCDAFGNCHSTGGGGNCRDSGSSKCESSLKF